MTATGPSAVRAVASATPHNDLRRSEHPGLVARTGLVVLAVVIVALAVSPSTWAATTERISVASDGTIGNRISDLPSISADGRYVAFFSRASNLVPGDSNGATDIFVRDRVTGTTERVSVASDGTQGNAWSDWPAISEDGRFVAFRSASSNLGPGDTNGLTDIFVHDLLLGKTERVSVASGGTQGNDDVALSSISADGRYVAFSSGSSNLVSGDTNRAYDVFVRDRLTNTTERVSLTNGGGQGRTQSVCTTAAISADGRYVVFDSRSYNFVLGDTNHKSDVFVRDRQTGRTRRVSLSSAGVEGDDSSHWASISPDGRYVAFHSYATNLVPGDTNGVVDGFVGDLQSSQTERVTVAGDGTQENQGVDSSMLTLSSDGRYVAFSSPASNLVGDDRNERKDVFVRDRQAGATELTSVAANGAQARRNSKNAAISPDGNTVVFSSYAANLVPGDDNYTWDVFARSR